ncbi:MAG TPA: PspA/IM30 family protein, partial [Myxococcaceae bacterium]|nr:PspA/IM30 family protein [Myxococcaceae bacterium]
MWNRFKRAMRSFFGFFVTSIEDPELILEQNIRDMNDQVPKMNESIAMVRANLTLLEKENAKYRQEVNELTAKV